MVVLLQYGRVLQQSAVLTRMFTDRGSQRQIATDVDALIVECLPKTRSLYTRKYRHCDWTDHTTYQNVSDELHVMF